MAMCYDKKRSSAGVVVVWFVVLGLALLVVDAAGKEGGGRAGNLAEEHGDAAYCSALCRGRSDFGPCYNECLYGRVTGQEEARGGGGVVGRAGLLAMPTDRAGREREEKGKQADAVLHLSDPVWCYDACREQKVMPQDQCVRECYAENMPDAAWLAANGGTGGQEARGGVVDGLKVVGIHKCDWFRDCSVTPCVWRCGKRMQEEVGLQRCDWFRDCSVTPCVWRCGKRMQEEVGLHRCDWFRDCSVTPCVWRCGKRMQEEVGLHKCDWFRDCSVTPCVWRCGKKVEEEEDAPLA